MFSADIAALHQFLFDLGKIRFAQSNVKCVADRFQILDIIGSFLNQLASVCCILQNNVAHSRPESVSDQAG